MECDLADARLCSTAYVLNLRGDDVPYNPVFHAYLYIGLDKTILFVDSNKLKRDVRLSLTFPPVSLVNWRVQVKDYLAGLDVTVREYNDVWAFLRLREWGDGKVRFFFSGSRCPSLPRIVILAFTLIPLLFFTLTIPLFFTSTLLLSFTAS